MGKVTHFHEGRSGEAVACYEHGCVADHYHHRAGKFELCVMGIICAKYEGPGAAKIAGYTIAAVAAGGLVGLLIKAFRSGGDDDEEDET